MHWERRADLNSPVTLSSVGAASHLPAGILSPCSDRERDALITGFANHQRCKKRRCGRDQPLLPVTSGEKVPAGG
ncbi:hypothetical protein MPLB_20081 [Mesorhizobium sp. ORS 3324]|nr:hypothetical protein MPLB_20081 [Mesorhizobium sp. ORS 3324]